MADNEQDIPDPNEPVHVYTVNEPTQAKFLRDMLHAEGIACEIEGENQGGFSGALGIRLFVRAKDADHALSYIKSHEKHGKE